MFSESCLFNTHSVIFIEENAMNIFHNKSGHIHCIGIIVTLLAMLGIGFLLKSYKENKIKKEVRGVVEVYIDIFHRIIKDPAEREKVERAFKNIGDIASRHDPKIMTIKGLIDSTVNDPKDNEKMMKAFSEIYDVLSKNNLQENLNIPLEKLK